MQRGRRGWIGALAGAAGWIALAGPAWAGERPAAGDETAPRAAALLSRSCLPCHNGTQKAGGIDLSSRAAAWAADVLGGGKPAASRLVSAVSIRKMPPKERLTEAQIALLRRWVAEGAPYPRPRLSAAAASPKRPWSFQPVRRPPVPKTPFDALARNPVDHFIFARLAKAGLRPSPPAERVALLRRVTMDLTGLPPTPGEIAAFLADSFRDDAEAARLRATTAITDRGVVRPGRWTARNLAPSKARPGVPSAPSPATRAKKPDAYEKAVDRLLASLAYGERWARHWLDVVRYGESHGYEQNHLRPNAWPYRDWVIRALNEDKPYPRFVMEQLAGDALGKGDPNVEAATGFLVAGVHDTVGIQTEEGTRQQRANDLDDIVATTGAAFLGLTIGCARCHDHKFDPIPQQDYYRLAAVFAGVRHGERSLATPEQQEAARRESEPIAREIATIDNALNEVENGARARVLRARGEAEATRPPVNARRTVDDFPPVTARFVRFTVLATRDGTEPCLDELQIFGATGEENLALASRGAKATASSLLPGFPIHQVEHLNDGRLGNAFSWISSTRGSGWAQIELPEPAAVRRVVWSRDGGEIPRFDDRLPTAYRIEVSTDGERWQTVATEAGRAGSSDYIHPDQLQAVMTPEERERLRELRAKRAKLREAREREESRHRAYIGTFTAPEPVYLLRRGDVMQREAEVTPGALAHLAPLPAELALEAKAPEQERRLALARWITDPRNPLTARVLVNRVWQGHFGRGLVGTPSDFGLAGESPTHPELLDWLAATFVAKGSGAPGDYACDGSLKRLHRLLVTSYVYRQASAATAKGTAVDAGNALLWRMPLRRAEAEAVRDAILHVSGTLDRRMGGPSYRLFRYRVVNVAIYEPLEEPGPETWRRGIYQQAARGIRDDLLAAFDCPESSQRAPRRENTTTALQALTLLNGPFLRQQSEAFAARVRRETVGTPAAWVERAFRLAFGRPPRGAEKREAIALVGDEGLPALCRALLNANEFLYY
jgi:cytochrome c553